MELRYRPKFRRDLQRLKGKAALNEKIHAMLKQIKSSEDVSDIPSHKPLDEYKKRFRIKIKLSTREDYRLGFIVKGNTVWVERILPRSGFYKFYKR